MTLSWKAIVFALLLGPALWAGSAISPGAVAEDRERDSDQESHQDSTIDARERLEMEKALRQARRELAAAARRVQEIQTKLVERRAMDQAVRQRQRSPRGGRARIGVVVDTEQPGAPGAGGATVVAITPGSAAEEAGLRPGDVILAINGKPLVEPSGGSGAGEASAAAALVAAARRLEPGDRVVLDYRRDGRRRQIVLEARPAPDAPMVIAPQSEPHPVQVPSIALEQWPYALLGTGSDDDAGLDEQARTWLDLEMVALNPELGRYFGAKSGILVLRAPEGDMLKVKSGDVIVKIGDAKPATPWQALRTLRGFEPGEIVNLELIRDRNVVVVKAKAPAIRKVFVPREVHEED